MIISHKHKFIFIKTAKTAGTSIELALAQICGEEDVITPFSAKSEKERTGRPPQNLELDHPARPKRPLWRQLLGRPERPWHPSVGYYSHMPAWRVRTYVGEEIWNAYFTFAFERNPWDRQVSHYHYKVKNKDPKPDFASYLGRKKRAFVDNFDLYSVDGEIIVDFVGRYENLVEDFDRAMARIGLEGQVFLPEANKTRDRAKDYRSYFTPETRDKVAKWYGPEIAAFGYSFDDGAPHFYAREI
ncbi:MAG: hypothetical protein EP340_02125 [Alphaproteobacteria bacterium]|nr:MAG: hypothetical protein EP340_02125 [Alphaproteobacteria bacterium]